MEDKYIQQLKKVYVKQTTSEHEVFLGWENLKHRLPAQETPKPFYTQYRYVFAGIALFLLVGSVITVQAATPSHPLYQMKVAMDNTVAKVLGKPEIAIDNRTNDVIKAAKQEQKQLPKAVDAYQKTVNNAANKEKKESAEDKKTFKQNLTEQENKLKTITPTNAADQGKINNAITQTEQAKQEVKGASTSNFNSGNSNNNNTDHGNSNGNNGNNESNNAHQNQDNGNSNQQKHNNK